MLQYRVLFFHNDKFVADTGYGSCSFLQGITDSIKHQCINDALSPERTLYRKLATGSHRTQHKNAHSKRHCNCVCFSPAVESQHKENGQEQSKQAKLIS
ncbi:hypothetical protein D1872_287450 [compost metagenome]